MLDTYRDESRPMAAELAKQDAMLAGAGIDPRHLVRLVAPWPGRYRVSGSMDKELCGPDLGVANGEARWQGRQVGVGIGSREGAAGRGILSDSYRA